MRAEHRCSRCGREPFGFQPSSRIEECVEHDSELIFPGQQRLADDIGVSRQTANEYIQDLKRKGFVKITCLGQGRTNIYELKVTKGKLVGRPIS